METIKTASTTQGIPRGPFWKAKKMVSVTTKRVGRLLTRRSKLAYPRNMPKHNLKSHSSSQGIRLSRRAGECWLLAPGSNREGRQCAGLASLRMRCHTQQLERASTTAFTRDMASNSVAGRANAVDTVAHQPSRFSNLLPPSPRLEGGSAELGSGNACCNQANSASSVPLASPRGAREDGEGDPTGSQAGRSNEPAVVKTTQGPGIPHANEGPPLHTHRTKGFRE